VPNDLCCPTWPQSISGMQIPPTESNRSKAVSGSEDRARYDEC